MDPAWRLIAGDFLNDFHGNVFIQVSIGFVDPVQGRFCECLGGFGVVVNIYSKWGPLNTRYGLVRTVVEGGGGIAVVEPFFHGRNVLNASLQG